MPKSPTEKARKGIRVFVPDATDEGLEDVLKIMIDRAGSPSVLVKAITAERGHSAVHRLPASLDSLSERVDAERKKFASRKRASVLTRFSARAQLWRIVDGSVRNTMIHHADYFTEKGMRTIRSSLVKRVVGDIIGFLEQSKRE